MGDCRDKDLRVQFDRRLKVKFPDSQVTTDAPGFGTVLLIYMPGPIGLLIELMGRRREKGLCAV